MTQKSLNMFRFHAAEMTEQVWKKAAEQQKYVKQKPTAFS